MANKRKIKKIKPSEKKYTEDFDKAFEVETERYTEDFEQKFEDELEELEDETEQETGFEEENIVKRSKPMNFAYWKVGECNYKLKLKTKSIENLENRYRTNLVNLMGNEAGMPPLKTMLEITHEAMKEWYHGVKYENVVALFDRYINEGGSQLSFYTNVFIGIYIASGFFSKEMAEEMMSSMEEAQKMI
ncbi:MAG: hypothetical protein K2N34_14865 [Lachnospiraceae bacterium]|nr:hypothetical protein [Lachnospiraceae bacterium]